MTIIKKVKKPKQISHKKWNDWRWQLRNSVESIEELTKWLPLSDREKEDYNEVRVKYRFKITPYCLNLIDAGNEQCPIKKQFLPHIDEIRDTRGWDDPKKEENTVPVECLFRIYPDRLVLYLTNCCATFCRHCLRKRRLAQGDVFTPRKEIDQAIKWIGGNKEIRDVLITGGDPLLASDLLIEYVLKGLRKIPHVEIIRIGTRTLSTLPQRITPSLARMIKKYHPVWVNTQFNHPNELTEDVARACDILSNSGIPLGNQSVLLKGVNDNEEVMKELVHGLVQMRVRPYYLYHCHFVKGGMHFQTSVDRGREIIKKLQGHTTGFAVPRYIVSTPKGKIPIHHDYVVKRNSESIVLENYEGKKVEIPI